MSKAKAFLSAPASYSGTSHVGPELAIGGLLRFPERIELVPKVWVLADSGLEAVGDRLGRAVESGVSVAAPQGVDRVVDEAPESPLPIPDHPSGEHRSFAQVAQQGRRLQEVRSLATE